MSHRMEDVYQTVRVDFPEIEKQLKEILANDTER